MKNLEYEMVEFGAGYQFSPSVLCDKDLFVVVVGFCYAVIVDAHFGLR